MLGNVQSRLLAGVRNLLINCAGCTSGQSVLIVYETERDGYSHPDLAYDVARLAVDLGLKVELHGVPLNNVTACLDAEMEAKIQTVDCAVFFARLGDQIRFHSKTNDAPKIMNYALDHDMLASRFGMTNLQAFVSLKTVINQVYAKARNIHVTCPVGTDLVRRAKTRHKQKLMVVEMPKAKFVDDN